ncbi:MAG: hypothetical protein ACREQ7_07820 [Candidatus Binatia bacterium]
MRDIRWARRGFVASLLIAGAGTLAAKLGSWLHLSPVNSGDYEVVAQWAIPAGGKGLIISVTPRSTIEELRLLGKRLQKQFRTQDNVTVMIFDDAEAARQVRRGSRIVGEKSFQAAVVHQRAMYLKSSPRGEDSFTIYKSYPVVSEVIRFG